MKIFSTDQKCDDRAKEEAGNKIHICPAVIEEDRRPAVIGMGDDIGKACKQGQHIQDLVFPVISFRQVYAKADRHHVS